MKITYNKDDVKKEVKKELKKIDRVYINFDFDTENNTGIMTVSATKYNIKLSLNYEIITENNRNVKRIHVDIYNKDVILDFLLEKTFYIIPYSKNLDNISINNNNTEYWMDTIEIVNEKRTKYVKHDEICFSNCKMIYKEK
jgi:pectate lyase